MREVRVAREYREFRPSAALAAYVDCLWILRSRSATTETVQRVFPDGCADVFVMDEDLFVAGPATRHHLLPMRPGACISGVRMRPGFGSGVLRVSADQIRNQILPLSVIWGKRTTSEIQLSVAESDATAHLHRLERFFLSRADTFQQPDPVAKGALRQLLCRPSEVPIKDLAWNLGVSERHLRRTFRSSMGFGLKRFYRIRRFQRLLDRLRAAAPPVEWAMLAQESGYSDQSHLIRDVHEFAGVTPCDLLSTIR